MKNAAAPSLSSPSISDKGNNIITLGDSIGPGSILVGVGNTSSSAVPTREQLYNCLDGKNNPLYVCKRFNLPTTSSEILFSVNGQKNQVYVATINSYVYRLLGSGAPTGTTITVPGTVINVPNFVAVAPGNCSSMVTIAIGGTPITPPPKNVSIIPTTI